MTTTISLTGEQYVIQVLQDLLNLWLVTDRLFSKQWWRWCRQGLLQYRKALRVPLLGLWNLRYGSGGRLRKVTNFYSSLGLEAQTDPLLKFYTFQHHWMSNFWRNLVKEHENDGAQHATQSRASASWKFSKLGNLLHSRASGTTVPK